RDFQINAVAHITGGGHLENIPRVLPKGCAASLESSKWTMPPVMELIEREGRVDREEMLRTFNCGVGMIIVVPSETADAALKKLRGMKEKASVIGEIVKKRPRGAGVIVS
ncbi:MAG: AIR synthase-related protein, partial [Candidatus Dadabacteria bacterium]